ncbi:LysR family transcriptional regulator [Sandaracinobacter sp. RS1-74]|uniref:LysR family transcriptional regulator n=1 Tax=Sandaracinobacteroides sayramensis TaxID=2913411 RepID=UPI001EDABB0F|nr:LysR family transcriptional regulator [Sandaracinobacteroides sayramensis]MCG2841236.1 LysR family transcriptional regulator [Sandaracinobacteroides sayramensis]
MPFDLKQLRYALATARHGSFGHAAAALDVVATAIEEQVAALEAQLRFRLFDDDAAGLRTTADGARFLRDAEHLLWQAEQVALRLADARIRSAFGTGEHRPFEPFDAPCTCSDPLFGLAHTDHPPTHAHEGGGPPDAPAEGEDDRTARYADLCRAILAARRYIGRAFGHDLIADPASEMLLDLYVREHEGRTTSITSFWGAASAAFGTARRSFTVMENRALVTRTPDPGDGRRVLVQLTPSTRRQLEQCFDVILAGAAQSVDAIAGTAKRTASG